MPRSWLLHVCLDPGRQGWPGPGPCTAGWCLLLSFVAQGPLVSSSLALRVWGWGSHTPVTPLKSEGCCALSDGGVRLEAHAGPFLRARGPFGNPPPKLPPPYPGTPSLIRALRASGERRWRENEQLSTHLRPLLSFPVTTGTHRMCSFLRYILINYFTELKCSLHGNMVHMDLQKF